MSWFKKTPKRENALQVSDYPKAQFSAYWEKVLEENIGVVRFYDYTGKLLTYSTFEAADVVALENKIDDFIVRQMVDFRK